MCSQPTVSSVEADHDNSLREGGCSTQGDGAGAASIRWPVAAESSWVPRIELADRRLTGMQSPTDLGPDPYILVFTGAGFLIALVAWLPLALQCLPLSLPIVCIALGAAVFSQPWCHRSPAEALSREAFQIEVSSRSRGGRQVLA